MLLLFLVAGCDWSAGSTILLGEDDTGQGLDSAADTAGDTAIEDTGTAHPSDVDDDQDGWTENEGDCDDADPTVHPDLEDVCNGTDDDCDGTTDEDGDGDDKYEPNDTEPTDLGSLEEDTSRSIVATLTNDDDVDRFQFTIVDDLLDFFEVTATLSNIPDTATYRFTLNRLRSDGDEAIGEVDQVFGSDTLTLSMGDETAVEDGGDYELVVEAIAGADCSRTYLLGVAQ